MAAAKKTKKATEQVEAAMAAGKETVETVVKATTEAATKGYEKAFAMTQEQVQAAVKNGTDAFKGYEDMVSFGKDNVEAVMVSGTILAKGIQDLNEMFFGLAQASLENSVNASKAIMACETVPEMVEIQNDLARENYNTFLSEGRKVSDMSAKVAEKALEPITHRVNTTVEKFAKQPIAA